LTIIDGDQPEDKNAERNSGIQSQALKSRMTGNKAITMNKGGKSAMRVNNGTSGEITTSRYNIIGAYISCKLQDGGNYFGDDDCYMFTLEPNLQTFYSSGMSPNKNYVKFNTRATSGDVGLGFGKNKNKCRLWLGKNLKQSYVLREDDTFESGTLIDGGASAVNIMDLEILGCGSEHDYMNYQGDQTQMLQHRAEERQIEEQNMAQGLNKIRSGVTITNVVNANQPTANFGGGVMTQSQIIRPSQ